MEDNRVELANYSPILAVVEYKHYSCQEVTIKGKIRSCKSIPSLVNATVYIKVGTDPKEIKFTSSKEYAVVDLRIYDTEKFNVNTKRWKGGTPTVVPLTKLLVDDAHPLCFIPKRYRKYEINVRTYLRHVITDEKKSIESGVKDFNSEHDFMILSRDLYEKSLITGEDTTFHRFERVKYKRTYPALTEKFNRLLGIIKYFEDFSYIYQLTESFSKYNNEYCLDSGVHVPVMSEEDKKDIMSKARFFWSSRNCWNFDPPNEVEFEDNTEMLEKVKQHLSMIKGLEITYLRKRMLAYYSDGAFATSPDAAIRGHRPWFLVIYSSYIDKPLLYSGEAWSLHFTINNKDYQRNNFIYFCTPDQYVKAMTSMGREDLLENWEPWSDLMFISSDWCERNGKVNYNKGIDLSTPHRRRLSLATWILGPFIQKCIEDGLGNPLEGFATIVSPKFNRDRWRAITEARKVLSEVGAIQNGSQ
jgi:hypothetical protein